MMTQRHLPPMVRRKPRKGQLAEAHDGVESGLTAARAAGWMADNDPEWVSVTSGHGRVRQPVEPIDVPVDEAKEYQSDLTYLTTMRHVRDDYLAADEKDRPQLLHDRAFGCRGLPALNERIGAVKRRVEAYERKQKEAARREAKAKKAAARPAPAPGAVVLEQVSRDGRQAVIHGATFYVRTLRDDDGKVSGYCVLEPDGYTPPAGRPARPWRVSLKACKAWLQAVADEPAGGPPAADDDEPDDLIAWLDRQIGA